MQNNVAEIYVYEVQKLKEDRTVEVLFKGSFDRCKAFLLDHFGHMTVEKFLDLNITIN